jgi:hypothetical protein
MKRLILGVAIASLSTVAVPAAQSVRQGEAPPVIPHVFQSPMIIETVFAAADRAQWGKRGWFDNPEYRALGQNTCDGVALQIQMRAKALSADNLEVGIRVYLWNPRHNHDKAVTLILELLTDPPIPPMVIGPMRKEDNGGTDSWRNTFTVPIRALSTDPQTPLRITMTTKDY